MSCGCGCNNCGDAKTPTVSGTEVTILSGLDQHSPRSNGNGESSPKTGLYMVLGSVLALAATAAFVVRKP
jgi:hypothetical protein